MVNFCLIFYITVRLNKLKITNRYPDIHKIDLKGNSMLFGYLGLYIKSLGNEFLNET